jgi:hypothetical protein
MDQSEPRGYFGWERLAITKTERWTQGQGFALFIASHDGYMRLASPVLHRRLVLALRTGLFLVRDLAHGRGKHRLEVSWHLAPDAEMAGPNFFRFPDGQSLAILPADPRGWQQEICAAECSPVYGRKQRRSVLKFRAVAELPAQLVTLLVPAAADVPLGSFTNMGQEDSSAIEAYSYSAAGRECWFFLAAAAGPWRCGRLASDAHVICWDRRLDSGEEDVTFCDGSYLEIGGRLVLRCKRRVGYCEMNFCPEGRKISCSDPDAVEEQLLMGGLEQLEQASG